MPHEVIMPVLGMAQDTGVIVCWRKEIGDEVAIGDALFDVETDKTTMEVEAAHAGFLAEIRADAGVDVPVGETIALIAEVPTGTRVNLGPETTRESAPKLSKPSPSPVALTPSEPPAVLDRPAAPSTSSAVPILASPKAKFEAHRRGIDLKRLVDQGMPQPFHVADLDRLKPETATSSIPAVSLLTATFEWSAFEDFIAWAEKKTGKQKMRQVTLAAFAASAFRAEVRLSETKSLTVSVLSAKAKASEVILRDPDLQGLGDLADITADGGAANPDLTLIDLSGTKLTEYQPPAQQGRLSIVILDKGRGEAAASLRFYEDDLPLLTAARFLDSFATRTAEPILQLL